MVEAEVLISQLRNQVRHLQLLLNYLENREEVQREDYSYSHTKLRELIENLKALERFSLQRGAVHNMRAAWLN